MKLPSGWVFLFCFYYTFMDIFIRYFFGKQKLHQHNHSLLYLFNLFSGIFLVSEKCKNKKPII